MKLNCEVKAEFSYNQVLRSTTPSAPAPFYIEPFWRGHHFLTRSGYTASNFQYTHSGITADLKLRRPACDVYGLDLKDLRLAVDYETGDISIVSCSKC